MFIFKIVTLSMGKFCKECGKVMRKPSLSHCSDECIFAHIKNSKSLSKGNRVEQWGDKADPWI